MERVYRLLERWGYPKAGIDWLRRLRAPIALLLAVVSWWVVVLLGWGISGLATWLS